MYFSTEQQRKVQSLFPIALSISGSPVPEGFSIVLAEKSRLLYVACKITAATKKKHPLPIQGVCTNLFSELGYWDVTALVLKWWKSFRKAS